MHTFVFSLCPDFVHVMLPVHSPHRPTMKLTPRLRTLHPEHNLVIHGVPRTWLPQDVTTALEEIGATRSGAPTLGPSPSSFPCARALTVQQ